MNFDKFVKKYNLLKDEEGRYYQINTKGEKEEPYTTIHILSKIFNLGSLTINRRLNKIPSVNIKGKNMRIVKAYNINEVIKACSELITTPQIINSEQYATISQLVKILNLAYDSIGSRIENLKPIQVKDKFGHIVNVYQIEEVKKVCADLFRELPIVDKNGIAIINGAQYAHVHALTKLFKLGTSTVRNRLKKLTPVKIKTKNGQRTNAYNIKEAKKACADLLSLTSSLDEDGIVVIRGEKYTSVAVLVNIIGFSFRAIERRIVDLQPLQVKGRQGHIVKVYKIAEVKKACKVHTFKKIPEADDENGLIFFKDQEYASINALSQLLGISHSTINRRISALTPIKGKGDKNQVINFFNIDEVKEICNDLLVDIPTMDSSGIISVNKEKYARFGVLQKLLNLSQATITRRMKKVEKFQAKSADGRIWTVYNIKEAKKACADLMRDVPIVDENGIAIFQKKIFTNKKNLSSLLDISETSISRRVKNLQPITIKNKGGQIVKGYDIEEVKIVCSDLIEKNK